MNALETYLEGILYENESENVWTPRNWFGNYIKIWVCLKYFFFKVTLKPTYIWRRNKF